MASPRSTPGKRKGATPPQRRAPVSGQTVEGAALMKIGEAARQLGVEAYVLRFWESQFPFLRPRHSGSSHRLYQPRDLETFRMVKRLLHVEGFTIAGAKRHIRKHGVAQLCANGAPRIAEEPGAAAKGDTPAGPAEWGQTRAVLREIRDELAALRDALRRD